LHVERLEERLMLSSFAPVNSPAEVDGQSSFGDLTSAQSVGSQRTTAVDGNGFYQVVWDEAPVDAEPGIYTTEFNSSGQALIGELHVGNTGLADTGATIASSGQAEYVIAWTHYASANGYGPSSVELQFFNGAESTSSVIDIPSGFSSGSAQQPSVAYNGSEVVLAYTDANASGTISEVKAVEVSTSGAQTPITVTASTSASQPSVAIDPSTGDFVIAYTQGASAPGQVNTGYVVAQQFSSDGDAQGTPITVNSSSVVENEPSVAYSDGEFVVAYTDVVSSTFVSEPLGSYIDDVTSVDAFLYNSQGTGLAIDPVWTSSEPGTLGTNAYGPSVAMDGSGNYVISFTKGGNFGSGNPGEEIPSSVWATAYSSTGAVLQGTFPLVPTPAPGISPSLSDAGSSVALSSSGGELAADWVTSGIQLPNEAGDGSGVFTQPFANSPFTFTAPSDSTISIVGGVTSTYQINIARESGFTGAITASFSPLPTGVMVTTTGDNPDASSEVLTVTFTSNNGTAPQQLNSTLTISGGQLTFTPHVLFLFTPSVITSIEANQLSSAYPNTVIPGDAATIIGSGFEGAYEVTFGDGGPSATATSVTNDLLQLIVPAAADYPLLGGNYIYILRHGGSTIESTFEPTFSEGVISSMNPTTAFAAGDNVEVAQGTTLTLFGYGFEPGDLVLFGPQITPPSGAGQSPFNPNAPVFIAPPPAWNVYGYVGTSGTGWNVPGDVTGTGSGNYPSVTYGPPQSAGDWLATADLYGTVPTAISPGGNQLDVEVPEDAVSGYVYVVHSDGYWMQSPSPLQVYTFRDSYGFSFQNGGNAYNGNQPPTIPPEDDWADFEITRDDISEEFPGAFDPLNFITSNLQIAGWDIKLNNNGTCFGMDVTASLIYQAAATDFASFGNVTDIPQTPPTGDVWGTGTSAPPGIDFSSPDAPVFSLAWSSTISMNGLTLPLIKTLELNLTAQMSVFVTTTAVDQAAEYAGKGGSGSVPDFMGRITGELAAGRPPVIAILPAGHSILAYSVQSDGDGGYYINCYNPNDPVDSSYAGDHDIYNAQYGSSPGDTGQTYPVETQAGMLIEDNQDRIHVDSSGNWSWTQDDGTYYHGNLSGGGLFVVPVDLNAVHHDTPFVGPAGTMSLPNISNDGLIQAVVAVIAIIAIFDSSGAAAPAATTGDLNSPPISLDAQPGAGASPMVAQAATPMVKGGHSAKVWWVGSAPGSNFPDIQAAIDSPLVQNGATIKVEPGTYDDAGFAKDTVTVDKSLTIIGGESFPGANHQGPSIVTSDGAGFTLDADDIAIEHFTIRAATVPEGTTAIGTASGLLGSGYQIRDNVIEDERYGLILNTAGGGPSRASAVRALVRLPRGPAAFVLRDAGDRPRASRAEDREAVSPGFAGRPKSATDAVPTDRVVRVRPVRDLKVLARRGSSSSTTVSGNSFVNNGNGIFSNAQMSSVTISGNHFTGDADASVAVTGSAQSSKVQIQDNQIVNDAAIILQNVTSSKIEGNSIVNPGGINGDGIWLDGGVSQTQVERNSLQSGTAHGIGIDSSGAGNAGDTISSNRVSNFTNGIGLSATTSDSVTKNATGGSSGAGIELSNGSSQNTIKGNSANGNFVGVALLSSNSNTITRNTTDGNANDGIAALTSNNDSFTHDTANGNTGAIGILVSGSGDTVTRDTADSNTVGIASIFATGTVISNNATDGDTNGGVEKQ
jgi:nitrous oxidase accessory protein NosD